MKTLNDILKKKVVLYPLIGLGGFLLGMVVTPGNKTKTATPASSEQASDMSDMAGMAGMNHGSITMDSTGDNLIRMSAEAMALSDVETSIVLPGKAVKNIRLYGTVTADEQTLMTQTSHIGGRIERLAVNFTGEYVRMGQPLVTVYSPELYVAQEELIEAVGMNQPELIEAAKEKLRLWKISEEQIQSVMREKNPVANIEIKANSSGIVINKRVSQGNYIQPGEVLFELADLSVVWVIFDAYETDLPFISVGDMVHFSIQAVPGKMYMGKVAFVDQVVNSMSRTAGIRVVLNNPNRILKPGMYASALIKAPLKNYPDNLIVPETAVLWTGKRSLVYVRDPHSKTPAFMMKEVELGPFLGDSYVILSGLKAGEEVVTNGVFSIDASAQLAGHSSMMNQGSTNLHPMSGHNHSMPGMTGMDMSNGGSEARNVTTNNKVSPEKMAMFTYKGTCNECKSLIEGIAKKLKGVNSVTWEQNSAMLHIMYDPTKTSPEMLGKMISQQGFMLSGYKVNEDMRKKLPKCCR